MSIFVKWYDGLRWTRDCGKHSRISCTRSGTGGSMGFFTKPRKTHRNVLRILISRQCDNQEFIPLNREYKLVPSQRWLVGKTPLFFFTKDCNKRVHKTVNKMLDYAAGMVVVATDKPLVDHCLVIVCMAKNMNIMFYDPTNHLLTNPSRYKIKRIWM